MRSRAFWREIVTYMVGRNLQNKTLTDFPSCKFNAGCMYDMRKDHHFSKIHFFISTNLDFKQRAQNCLRK